MITVCNIFEKVEKGCKNLKSNYTIEVYFNNWANESYLYCRRSTERVGTRLFVRGADIRGNVANYVETEQIVEVTM